MDYRQQMFPQMTMQQPSQQYGNYPPSMQYPSGQMPSTGPSFSGGGQSQLERRVDRLEKQMERMNRRITQVERQMQYWGQMGHH